MSVLPGGSPPSPFPPFFLPAMAGMSCVRVFHRAGFSSPAQGGHLPVPPFRSCPRSCAIHDAPPGVSYGRAARVVYTGVPLPERGLHYLSTLSHQCPCGRDGRRVEWVVPGVYLGVGAAPRVVFRTAWAWLRAVPRLGPPGVVAVVFLLRAAQCGLVVSAHRASSADL